MNIETFLWINYAVTVATLLALAALLWISNDTADDRKVAGAILTCLAPGVNALLLATLTFAGLVATWIAGLEWLDDRRRERRVRKVEASLHNG